MLLKSGSKILYVDTWLVGTSGVVDMCVWNGDLRSSVSKVFHHFPNVGIVSRSLTLGLNK